jgi:hypothetical protein
MTEISKPWDGTTSGDAVAAPYTADEWSAIQSTIGAGAAIATYKGGVARDELSELLLSGVASPLTIASGRALVNGYWYENDSNVSVTVTATPSTRVDRIVLRLTYGTPNIRITRLAGTDGSATPPSLVNNGTSWDIPLWKFTISSSGTIGTIVDERGYTPWHGDQSLETGTKHAYGQLTGAPVDSGSTPVAVTPGVAGVTGTALTIARHDHRHALTPPGFAILLGNETKSLASSPVSALQFTSIAGKYYAVDVALSVTGDDAIGASFTMTDLVHFISMYEATLTDAVDVATRMFQPLSASLTMAVTEIASGIWKAAYLRCIVLATGTTVSLNYQPASAVIGKVVTLGAGSNLVATCLS